MEGSIFFIAVLINAGLAFIPAKMARDKGYSYGGFWCLSFFVSFIVGIIVAVCITDKNEFVRRDEYNQQRAYTTYGSYCPNCGGAMREGDLFCAKCGSKV